MIAVATNPREAETAMREDPPPAELQRRGVHSPENAAELLNGILSREIVHRLEIVGRYGSAKKPVVEMSAHNGTLTIAVLEE